MSSLFRRSTIGPSDGELVEAAVDATIAASPIDDVLARLLATMRFELVPVASVETAIAELPPGTAVSVTCSPSKGLGATLDVTARLLDGGHDVVPHLAARLVEDRQHVRRLAAWLRHHHVEEIFVVGGDETVPVGRYADGASLLADLFEHDTGLTRVGVPTYPDGHPAIPAAELHTVLHRKQALIAAAGLEGSATTQMCFDAAAIRTWLHNERAAGLALPIDLGIPGIVDRAKLMSMGVRLGIGSSLRFLRKQRTTMTALLAPGGYDPTELVTALAADASMLRIDSVHSFTFNCVARTAAWRRSLVGAP